MKNKIIIRENKNFISQFYLKFFNKKNDLVYFFNSYQIDVFQNGNNYCKGIKEIKLNHETEVEITFEANKLAIDYMNHIFDEKNDLFSDFLISKFKTNKIIIALKKYLVRSIQDRIRIILIYFYFLKNYPAYDIKVMFDKCELSSVNNFMKFNYSKHTFIWYWYLNKYRINLHNLFYVIFYLPLITIRNVTLNGIRITRPKIELFDIGQHLANGFFSKDIDKLKKIKGSRNDDQLYSIIPKNYKYLFIYSNWKFSKEEKKIYNRKIFENNKTVCDEIRLKLTLHNLKCIFKDYFNLLSLYFGHFKNMRYSEFPIRNYYLILKDAHEHELFCSYYRVKIFFSRDDFNAKHVTRTIIQNKYELKHCSIHHSLFLKPYTSLIFLYSYYDFYFTHGSGYIELYKNNWYSKENLVVGNPNINQILDAMKDFKKRQNFKKLYKNKFNILLLLPSIGAKTNFNNTNILKKCFANIDTLLNNNKNTDLIIRPRNYNQYKMYQKVLKFKDELKPRIHFELSRFNTYELIAYSDFLIADSTSSSLIEAFSNNKIVIIPLMIRLKNKCDLIWADYSPDTIFENIEHVSKYINRVINGHINFHEDKEILLIKEKFSSTYLDETWVNISRKIISKLNEFSH